MTALEFRQQHGDPTTWTTDDMETFENLAVIDAAFRNCWFCAAENPAQKSVCGFCNHHADDGPDPMPTQPATPTVA